MSGKEKAFRIGLVLAVAAALLLSALAFVEGRTEIQEMSASGYLLTLDDGEGTVQFSVSDAGVLNYGSNDMYPLGYASSGQELVCATTTITGENQTVTVTGLTTVTYGFAWLIADPGTSAGDPWMVTTDAAPGDGTIVVNVWQDDANAATSGAAIGYCGIGDE
jgi:hypothetical protein